MSPMTYTEGNIYLMKYSKDDEIDLYAMCRRITKRSHQFELLSSNEEWITPGTKINYSKKDLRNLFAYVVEYTKEKDPEYFL